MSAPDLPIALRTVGTYPAAAGSVFEDPGDEKSWHRSQRAESLLRFYEGREPSWYASAIRPLAGARRVLDLGCGPGLTLEALLEQGADEVLGVDRWPAFAAAADPRRTPIVVHDLTLPMPFLAPQSFDGILSHYALDYVSPIGMRQVLREAWRLLSPGGRLLIYIAAIGLGSGDETRTSPYSVDAMRLLLDEAGFAEAEVESSPNGRNTVASATRPPGSLPTPGEASSEIDGEAQLCASFGDSVGGSLGFVASDGKREARLELQLEPRAGTSVACCARAVALPDGGAELQAWAWRERRPVAAEALRLEFSPSRLGIEGAVTPDWIDAWAPRSLPVEVAGSAYAAAAELPPAAELDEARRGAEGRRIVVEGARLDRDSLERLVGPGANRLPVRRLGEGVTVADLDRDWLDGRSLGVVAEAWRLRAEEGLATCLWAGKRQALVLIEGDDWAELAAGALARAEDLRAPLLLIDPALSGGPPGVVAPEALALAGPSSATFLVLDPASRAGIGELPAETRRRLLPGGAQADPEAVEALRLLTERTLLMRLRRAYPRPLAELGRRPSLG